MNGMRESSDYCLASDMESVWLQTNSESLPDRCCLILETALKRSTTCAPIPVSSVEGIALDPVNQCVQPIVKRLSLTRLRDIVSGVPPCA